MYIQNISFLDFITIQAFQMVNFQILNMSPQIRFCYIFFSTSWHFHYGSNNVIFSQSKHLLIFLRKSLNHTFQLVFFIWKCKFFQQCTSWGETFCIEAVFKETFLIYPMNSKSHSILFKTPVKAKRTQIKITHPFSSAVIIII